MEIGDIFWVDDFPPLDGTRPARRPAIIIDLVPERLAPVTMVGITTDRSDPDAIALPNLRDEPAATTGLPEPCCALPRWLINVDPARLRPENFAGTLPRVTLAILAEAVDAVLSEYPPRTNPPGWRQP